MKTDHKQTINIKHVMYYAASLHEGCPQLARILLANIIRHGTQLLLYYHICVDPLRVCGCSVAVCVSTTPLLSNNIIAQPFYDMLRATDPPLLLCQK